MTIITEDQFRTARTAAEAYLSMDWRLFPCHTKNGKGCTCRRQNCSSPAKHPRTEKGLLDATNDQAMVDGWLRQYQSLNWGVTAGVQSGFWALDEDPRHGGDKSLAELLEKYGPLPETPTATTGSGGRHFIFRYPPGLEIRNREGGKNGMPVGLDVRGEGGYIVVAPAVNLSGQYRWQEGRSPLDLPVADAPSWLLNLVTAKKEAPRNGSKLSAESTDLELLMAAATRYIATISGAAEGTRNSTAFNIAGHLAAFIVEGSCARLSESQGLNLLRSWNDRNNPPLDDDELKHVCNMAFSGKGTPREDKVVRRRRGPRVQATSTESSDFDHSAKGVHLEHLSDVPSVRTPDGRTELANAKRFVALHGERVRWCDVWGKWLYWDARRWRIDDSCAVESMAKSVFEHVWNQVAKLKDDGDAIRFAKQTGSARGIANFLALARSEPGIAISPDKLDADPGKLNCLNGTLDLETFELSPHDREDLITRLCPTPYLPDADRRRWSQFLGEIMQGDAELTGFLRRATGSSIPGEVLEHALFFCFGEGANGKTTYLQAITDTLGDEYAMTAPPDLLMVKSGNEHPTALADLHGKRFVACIEAGEGRRMAESMVKSLTGGDKIRARRMREDFWEFRPSHSIWLAANHKPTIRGRDKGIWRRIKLVPFNAKIPDEKQDPALPQRLRDEAPGILAWMVEGYREWRQHGMQAPDAVKRATADYRDEMDVFGEFIAECCILGNPVVTPSSELYGAYGRWCARSGERQMSRTAFGNGLSERGLEKVKSGTVSWRGIELQAGA